MKHNFNRALLTLVAMHNVGLRHFNANTAFLHSNLEEDIDIKQPEEFSMEGQKNRVCLSKKSQPFISSNSHFKVV